MRRASSACSGMMTCAGSCNGHVGDWNAAWHCRARSSCRTPLRLSAGRSNSCWADQWHQVSQFRCGSNLCSSRCARQAPHLICAVQLKHLPDLWWTDPRPGWRRIEPGRRRSHRSRHYPLSGRCSKPGSQVCGRQDCCGGWRARRPRLASAWRNLLPVCLSNFPVAGFRCPYWPVR